MNPAIGGWGIYEGHHGIILGNSHDVLVANITLKNMWYVHDFGVTGGVENVAFANITATNLTLDHHGHAPYGVLWSNVEMGEWMGHHR